MRPSPRFVFVVLAIAAAGLLLFATSFLAGLALPWFTSLAEGERRAVWLTSFLAMILGLVVTAIVRWRMSDRDGES